MVPASECVLVCLDLTTSIFGMMIDVNVCDSLNANYAFVCACDIQLHHISPVAHVCIPEVFVSAPDSGNHWYAFLLTDLI